MAATDACIRVAVGRNSLIRLQRLTTRSGMRHGLEMANTARNGGLDQAAGLCNG
jgi:hypothetical protein